MNITIVDYSSGNISSVINSFKEACKNKHKMNLTTTINNYESRIEKIQTSFLILLLFIA